MISGKYMEAKIGTVFISGNYAWTAEETADELDASTGETGGYEDVEDGLWGCTVSLKGYMDVSTGQYTPVRRGTTITNLRLFRVKTDATPAFSFPSSKVLNSTQGGEVKGRIEWSARIKSKGAYTYADPA